MSGSAPVLPFPVPRLDARDKVTGRAQYVDDVSFPNLVHGATVRSPVARGRIRAVRFGDGVPWDEITVVTHRDVPGKNRIPLLLDDQPCLAEDAVNHPEEPIALLGHPDREVVEAARRAVRVECDPLPGVFDIEASLARREIVWGADNVLKRYLLEKGDVDAAFARDDVVVVEGEYRTGAQEQAYIEPNGMIAAFDPGEGASVWGSMQCPYYVHQALCAVLGLPADRVRVVQTETGGGFGGKEDYPSIVACHAALLARKAGRPVKIVYDRAEDMAATTKRHPSRTRHRTAVRRDGTLVAMDVEFVIDGGAYCTLSPVVLSRGTIHATGPYFCPNVRVRAMAVATNAPPHGAFRGFGAPQSLFAAERHMDRIARAVGLSPVEIRRRNFLRDGLETATGQIVRDGVDLGALLGRALDLAGYDEKRRRFAEENRASRTKKGIGVATFWHGCGFTGSGEKKLASVAAVEATAQGVVRVLASSTEIGQGKDTVFAQIAAGALGLPVEMVEVARPDTSVVPDSGPTVASRTSMVVGKLVERAAASLGAILRQSGLWRDGGGPAEFRRACGEYHRRLGPLRAESQYAPPPGIAWDDEHFRGDAYATYGWAAYVAEVAVDTRTYEVTAGDFVALQDVGRVLSPALAAGQVEGGVAQGVGWALCEKVEWKDGRMHNARLSDYIVPTSADAPRIRAVFSEAPSGHGPAGGAKGIGELPMDGPAPAVVSALEDALGVPVDRVPATPETLLDLVEAARA